MLRLLLTLLGGRDGPEVSRWDLLGVVMVSLFLSVEEGRIESDCHDLQETENGMKYKVKRQNNTQMSILVCFVGIDPEDSCIFSFQME